MDRLHLPEQLRGPWEHAVILTYGLDASFFEAALLKQFDATCRNRIILADGRMYREACNTYATAGALRHLNQRYIAEGVFAPRASHAKMILLTNETDGRLLVGSGNLTMQGFGSGGELFTRYEFNGEEEQLGPFMTARQVLEGLMDRNYLSNTARKHLNLLLEETPWLFKGFQGALVVRHNLEASFADQFEKEIRGRATKELWVLSPFLGRDGSALGRLFELLQPQRLNLILQEGRTSVDPEALHRRVEDFGSACRVFVVPAGVDTPYIHAKLYLANLGAREICVQGSPNLSHAAFFLTDPTGNLELANLVEGKTGEFDELIAALSPLPVKDVRDLRLSFEPDDESDEKDDPTWFLASGELKRQVLELEVRGDLPAKEWDIEIGGEPIGLVTSLERHSLRFTLPAKAVEKLQSPVPVRILSSGRQRLESNPIFVTNREALDNMLKSFDSSQVLGRFGRLDLGDEEFETLLRELEATLVFDRRSIWRVAGRRDIRDSEDDAPEIRYEDVDYELLKKHPKLQQYLTRASEGSQKTRLQILLNSIIENFRHIGVLEKTGSIFGESVTDQEEDQEEAGDEEGEDQQTKRWSSEQRLRVILRNFIRRYLRGLDQADVRKILGPEGMVSNYIIFSHLIWHLMSKDWVDYPFLLNAQFELWEGFWGPREGYLLNLDPEETLFVRTQLKAHDQDSLVLAFAYVASDLSWKEDWKDELMRLRNLMRSFLVDVPLAISSKAVSTAAALVTQLMGYEPPTPEDLVDDLAWLANHETDSTFLRNIEGLLGLPKNSCAFETKEGSFGNTQALVVNGDLSKDQALAVIAQWLAHEERIYYRIQSKSSRSVLQFDVSRGSCLWAPDQWSEAEDLSPPESSPFPWSPSIERLRRAAQRATKVAV